MLGWKRDIALLVLLQLALGLAYLETVPRIYVDEVWDSSLGYNLANTGSLRHPFVEGFGGLEIHFIQNRVVLPLVCAAVFKVIGYSITASRLGSVLFGALAVVSLYAVTCRWFGEKQAFWATLVTVIHPWFFEVSRRARPEIYYIGLGLVVLWLMTIFFDSGSHRAAFFTGVFAGLSSLTHPTSIILVIAIGCSVIAWQRGRMLGRLVIWGGIGFAITILPYIIYVFWALRNPQVNFVEQMQLGMLHRSFLSMEIIRWKGFLQWPKGAPLAVIMFISWVVAWYRSSTAEKTVATIIVLFILILSLATVSYTSRYLATVIPFFSILMVRLVWRIIEDKGGVIWQNLYEIRFVICMGTAFVYLAICTVVIGLMFYHLRGADFNKVIDRVASVVGPKSRIYGDPIFWVGHDRYKYGPHSIIMGELVPLAQALDIVHEHKFDYVVKTSWLVSPPKGFGRLPRVMPAFRNNCLEDHMCRLFGTKIDEFHDPYYGPVEIYKLNWDNYYKIRRGVY